MTKPRRVVTPPPAPDKKLAWSVASVCGCGVFLALLLSNLMHGVPPVDHLILSLLGAVAIGALAYQLGLIFGSVESRETEARIVQSDPRADAAIAALPMPSIEDDIDDLLPSITSPALEEELMATGGRS